MTVKEFITDSRKLSILVTIVTFLALIRCIAEPMRLQSVLPHSVSYAKTEPFLLASLACALTLLAITLLHYFGRLRVIVTVGIVNSVLLIIIKLLWAIP